jgi:hypothetical protein
MVIWGDEGENLECEKNTSPQTLYILVCIELFSHTEWYVFVSR